ncbi:hypothetical protein DL98DRAFT_606741 [Cadophora sp. DSE1049]|nr:hypothetical protein DL98DRAFT_606741 [Cadophora sp. DSE1049]
MALYCAKKCSQVVEQVGSICTLDGKSVPCQLSVTNEKVNVDVICGFETSQDAIDAGNLGCDSIQRKFTCTYQSLTSNDCFEELATAGAPTNAPTGTKTTSTSSSVSVPSSTTFVTGSSTITAPASGTTVGSTDTAITSIPEAKPTSASKDISPGAAAGVGIGSAIAGAVIAALVLLLLFGRYKKRHQESAGYSNHLPNYNSDLGRQEKELPIPTKTGVVVTESYLPQPAEDDAIIGELSRLRDNIKNHVQSFYITGPIDAQSLDRSLLGELGRDTGIQLSKLQDLLVNRTSRNSALRLCIGWIILSRCDGGGPADTSLLPDEAAAVAALISNVDYKDTRKATLASKLKVISGALLQTRSGQPQPLQSAKLEHRIEQALLIVNDFLTPFIDSSVDATTDKRIRNLESIVRRASQLAILLFSQPSSWAFDFGKSGTAQQGTIVVFPGLLETVSEDGIVRQPPRQFHQPEVTVAV